MPPARNQRPFSQAFAPAWKDCWELWPLFLVQVLLVLLKYATLALCLFLLFLPLAKRYGPALLEGLDDPSRLDPSALLLDLGQSLMDPSWVLLALGSIFLYTTWWMLISAVADGGIYGAFQRHLRDGEAFTWGGFFRDGLGFFGPMIWLGFYLFLLGLAPLLPFGTGLGSLLLAFTHADQPVLLAVGSLLALPLLLGSLLAWMAFLLFTFLATACLVRGAKPGPAIQEAWEIFQKEKFRAAKGILAACLLYLAAAFVNALVLGSLSKLPWIGWLFSLLDLALGTVLSLGIALYLPALATRYLRGKD